jgi:hypothetical protein
MISPVYAPPPLTLVLPRALLEHPLPTQGPGVSLSVDYLQAEGRFSLQIGGVDRWARSSGAPSPGLTLEGFTLLCALLVLRERGPLTYNALFRFLTPSSGTCSAHHRERLKQTLAELAAVDCALTSPSGEVSYAHLLSFEAASARAVFGRPTPAFIPVFHPAFLASLGDSSATTTFRMDSFLGLRSRLARVLFCFLPSWAHYSRASAAHPFRISLSKLIAHLGADVPRFTSARKAFFYGHRSQGLFDELQNIATAYGELSFALSPAASLEDDCVLVWFTGAPARRTSFAPGAASGASTTPASPNALRNLKLYQAWVASGRTEADFLACVQKPVALSPHDQELLAAAGVPLSSSGRFLTLAKKLLPERTWQDLLGEARYAATAATVSPRVPQAKLISEILSALKARL